MRFNVGVTTKPGDRLGFVDPFGKRRALVEQYGLDPRLADLAPDEDTLKKYAIQSILQKQEEATQQATEARKWDRLMERERREQETAQQAKQQRIEGLIQMSRGMKYGDLTPVQMKKMIETNPDAAERYLYGRRASISEESERVVREQAARKLKAEEGQKLLGEIAVAFPGLEQEAKAFVEARGPQPESLKLYLREVQKMNAERQKQAREAEREQARYMKEQKNEQDAARKEQETRERRQADLARAQAAQERTDAQKLSEFNWREASARAKEAGKAWEKLTTDTYTAGAAKTNPEGPEAQQMALAKRNYDQAQQALEFAAASVRQARGEQPGQRAAPPPEEAEKEMDTSILPPEAKRKMIEGLKTIPTREGRARYVREIVRRQQALQAGYR